MDSRDKWRKGVIRSWDDAYAYANTNDGNGLALWLEDRLYDPVASFELQESDMSFRVDAIGYELDTYDRPALPVLRAGARGRDPPDGPALH